MTNFQKEVRLLLLKRTTWKQRRHLLVSKKVYSSKSLLLFPSISIRPDVEQFLLIPASVYNKSLNNESFTTLELPKYQAIQNPTYQIVSLKKDMNKNLFATADSLVDNNLSRPRIKLSNSQTLTVNDVENGVSQSDFAKHLRCENADVPDFQLILLDAAVIFPTLVLKENAKTKDRGSWVLLIL